MRTIYATPDKPIILGHEGDSFATQVIFDLSYFDNWVENLSSEEEENYYLVVEKNGKTHQQGISINRLKKQAAWVVTNRDTAAAGDGRCQLFCQVDDNQNSIIFDTRVKNSIIKDFTFDDLNSDITIEDLLPEGGTPDQYMTLNDNGKLIWKDLPTTPIEPVDPVEPIDKNVVAILNITGATQSALTANFCFTQSKSEGVVVDFGDGSEPQVYTDTAVLTSHTYPSAGEYDLSIISTVGTTWEPGAYGKIGNTTTDQPFCSKPWITHFIFKEEVGFSHPRAFFGFSNLVAINNFPNITIIPDMAFQNCSKLENFKIPETITTVGESAFDGCSSLEITKFPVLLKTVGIKAFQNCVKLNIDYFPERLEIANYAFSGCTGLPHFIEIASHKIACHSFSGCSNITRAWLRNTVTTINDYLIGSTYYGIFTSCAPNLIIYAEYASKPSNWTQYFDLINSTTAANASTAKRFEVIWNISTVSTPTLRISWDENDRLLTHEETVANGSDYIYNASDESLEYV